MSPFPEVHTVLFGVSPRRSGRIPSFGGPSRTAIEPCAVLPASSDYFTSSRIIFSLQFSFRDDLGGARKPRSNGRHIDRRIRPWSERDERVRAPAPRASRSLV